MHDNNLDYYEKYEVPLLASVYIMFSGEDIGIKTSAIETVGSKDLDIFPNPASNSISISCENEKSGFTKIFDQLGRLVLKEMSVGCEEKSIDISALDTGLYFVRMTDNEGRIVGRGKFVKE